MWTYSSSTRPLSRKWPLYGLISPMVLFSVYPGWTLAHAVSRNPILQPLTACQLNLCFHHCARNQKLGARMAWNKATTRIATPNLTATKATLIPEILMLFTGYHNCTLTHDVYILQPFTDCKPWKKATTHTKLISYERHSRDSDNIHSLRLQPYPFFSVDCYWESPIMRPFGGTLRGSLICNLRTENEAGAFATLG